MAVDSIFFLSIFLFIFLFIIIYLAFTRNDKWIEIIMIIKLNKKEKYNNHCHATHGNGDYNCNWHYIYHFTPQTIEWKKEKFWWEIYLVVFQCCCSQHQLINVNVLMFVIHSLTYRESTYRIFQFVSSFLLHI